MFATTHNHPTSDQGIQATVDEMAANRGGYV